MVQEKVQAAEHPAAADPVQTEEASKPDDDGVWAARHLFIAVNGQWLAEGSKKFLQELKPGGVVLRDANLQSEAQTSELVKEIKRAVGFGGGLGDLPLIAVQEESGPYSRLGLVDAPSAQELGQSGDDALARKLGLSYAEACTIRGIGVTFSPVLDVYESGTVDPGLETRSFGSDQTVVANIGLAMVDGLREGGVIPVVKHFPGYGASTYASDGMLVVLNKDFNGLARVMYPFNEAVRRKVQGIVVGYVAVPALDKEDPRRPAALSPILVTDLLRNRWGFDGVILADDVARNEFTHGRPIERTAVEALAAGCDAVILLDANPQRITLVRDAIVEAVRTGELTREALDMSVERLSRWQDSLNISHAGKPAAHAMLRSPASSSASQEEKIPAPPLIQAPVQSENATASVDPVEEERSVVAKASPEIEFVTPEPEESAPVETVVPKAQGNATTKEEARRESNASDTPTALEVADTPVEVRSIEGKESESPSQDEGDVEPESDSATDEVVLAKASVAEEEPVAATIAEEPANDAPSTPGIPTEDIEAESEVAVDEVEAPETSSDEEAVEGAADIVVSSENLEALPERRAEDAGDVQDNMNDESQSDSQARDDAADSTPSAEPSKPEVSVVAKAPAVSRRSAPGERDGVEHTVGEDELLSHIARIYGVSAGDIVRWNDLRQAKLESGTKLMIYFGPEPSPEEDASGSDLTKLSFKLVHTVDAKDTVLVVAKRYAVSEDDLKLWNGLESDELQAGQKLTIFMGPKKPSDDLPELKTGEYEVQPGDTLNKIAREFFTTRELLLQLNKLRDPNHIIVGQKLKVPLGV